MDVPSVGKKMPEIWGHRGASSAFPENTLASFKLAIEEGSEGIESDVHCSKDGRILMFHDPTLDRCTDLKGAIKEMNWKDEIEHARTTREPHQPIPLFEELVDLLMKEENKHVKLNIDIKANNDPVVLFTLMKSILEKVPNYETVLAPRLILGIWHPAFLLPAKNLLPSLTVFHIGASISLANSFFFPHCSGFSMAFATLVTAEGQEFLRKCRENDKKVCVWTVNRPDECVVGTRWGVDAVLTDVPGEFLKLREEMKTDFKKVQDKLVSPLFSYSTWTYYTPTHMVFDLLIRKRLQRIGGAFVPVPEVSDQAESAAAISAAA